MVAIAAAYLFIAIHWRPSEDGLGPPLSSQPREQAIVDVNGRLHSLTDLRR